MFLVKKEMKPLGVGSFCKLNTTAREKVKQMPSAQDMSWDKVHFAETDVLYIIESKIMGSDDLFKVIAVSCDEQSHWGQKVQLLAEKSKTFLVNKGVLTKVVNWREEESVKKYDSYINNVLHSLNYRYDLQKKNLEIKE